MSKDVLFYVGDGRFIIGVPARDLTEQDVATLAVTRKELLVSGVYSETPAKEPKEKS